MNVCLKFLILSFFFLCFINIVLPHTLSDKEAHEIGLKIWNNECAGTLEGLTSWNEGENFASVGILHATWRPAGPCIRASPLVHDIFPALLGFMEKHGKKLPTGILKKNSKACPWRSREEFLAHKESQSMITLRKFLFETIDLQIKFVVQRLKDALPKMLNSLTTSQDKAHVKKQFYRVAHSPGGWYALIDYVNFKGEGTEASESYGGCRWGLLQVLRLMKGTEIGPEAVHEFVVTAKQLLHERVSHAPVLSHEKRWIPGWNKRLDSYVHSARAKIL